LSSPRRTLPSTRAISARSRPAECSDRCSVPSLGGCGAAHSDAHNRCRRQRRVCKIKGLRVVAGISLAFGPHCRTQEGSTTTSCPNCHAPDCRFRPTPIAVDGLAEQAANRSAPTRRSQRRAGTCKTHRVWASEESIAVELDLVQPVGATRWSRRGRRQAWLNKVGRGRARNTAALLICF
jgi:hypothetical protein